MAEQTQTKITAYSRPKTARDGGSTVINYNINSGVNTSSNINAKSATINRIKSELIDVNTINANTGNFVYLVGSDGTISTLRGSSLNYNSGNIDEIHSSTITTDEINATTGNITNLFNEYLQGKEIVTDYLTVNKSAHFFEVIIDKIRSVGGTIINTACNSTIDYVHPLNANDEIDNEHPTKYRCYFKRTQDDGTYITNDWQVNDQAICQACNLVPGVSYNKGTHYYWRLVKGRNNENAPVYVNFNTGEVDESSSTQPDYYVVFIKDSGITFTYTKTFGEQEIQEVTDYHYESDIVGDYTDDTDGIQLKIEDTIHGLRVIPNQIQDGTISEIVDGQIAQVPNMVKPVMIGGGDSTFSFETQNPTRLNVAFVFTDGTIEFHPIGTLIEEYNVKNDTHLNPDKDYLTEYNISIIQEKNIDFVSITSDEVNVWNCCHWIDLSNVANEYDTPTHLDGNNYDMKPMAGDNIVQLGYRYPSQPTAEQKSRASAIIIASYKTPDADIKPPSYAQYMDITDFDLSSHRKTFFDATRFVINNADIENTVLDTIRIIPEQNPVTKDPNGNFNTGANGFDVSFLINNSGTSTLTPYVPTDTYVEYTTTSIDNPVTVTAGYHPVVPLDPADTSITVSLYNNDDMIIDTLNVSIILMADISNGKNGEYDQWVYINKTSNPGYPNENNQENTESAATYPPTGGSGASSFTWETSPTTPTGTQNTWMTTRHVSFDNTNQPIYGAWSYPTRLNGEDGDTGAAGKDGKDIEFIYTVSQISSAEVGDSWVPNISYEEYNEKTPADDDFVPGPWSYIGYTGYWNDNPQGINSTYKYEYMAQRYTYTNNNGNTYWSYFTTPVLWSKWGEKGMDGDGVEYIFTSYNTGTLPLVGYPDYDAYNGKVFTDDDFVPRGWEDDPMSPTVSNAYVFVSQRKQKNGQWISPTGSVEGTPWSTPAIWANLSVDGQTGPQGPTGPDGNDGEGYVLNPVKRTWEVDLVQVNNQKYEALSSLVVADLEYKIAHWKGDDQIEDVDLETGDGWLVKAIVKDGSGTELKSYTFNKNTTYDYFKLNISNVLNDIGGHDWDDYDYDYRKIITNGTTAAINALPVTLEVQLLQGNKVINNDIRTLITEGKGLFVTTNSVLQSVYQGVGATNNMQYSNYFTNLQQTMRGIELSAAESIIGANGAFTTFGSTLPQTSTEKCFLIANNSYSYWPNSPALPNIYDSATPTDTYNNNGTVCYDGNSYWKSSSYMPELNTNNQYMWMVRGYRVYDSYNNAYTPWRVNTPILYGIYSSNGTIYNNSNLAITARDITASVSSISDTYATKSELTITANGIRSDVSTTYETKAGASGAYNTLSSTINQTADNIYAYVDSGITGINGDLIKTGIDIKDGTITLQAANTIVDGQMNVLGNFISDNVETLNKIVIDVDSGGLKLYGPSKIDEYGEVQSGATYKEIINIGFSDADENRQRTGFININQYDENVIPRSGITGASHRMLIEPTNGGIWMAGQNNTNINRLNINEYDITCIEYNSNGGVVGTYHKSWPELLQYNRIIRYDGTSEGQYGQIVADADYDYFFITNNTNPITLNISSTLFAEGRVIHIKGQNGTIIDNGNGNIVLKSGAWNHTNSTNAATSWTFPIKQKCFVYNNLDIKQSDYILTESYSISLMRYGTQWLEI